jgi:outer membrane receptor for ferrienterochelin and colicins
MTLFPALTAATGQQETPAALQAAGPDQVAVAGAADEVDLASLLENVVVSATKTALKEDQAPAITTVVSREEIRRWGYQSVAEVLSHVAGVYVIDDHSVPNVGIRGVSGGLRSESGLIKVMIDGRSVAFRSTAGNWLGAELVPLSAVQQIEIIRGPASALYGADAFLGVINVVTRQPEQMDGGEMIVSAVRTAASPGLGHDVSVGTTAGRWQLFASYRHSSEDRSGLLLPGGSPAPNLPPYAPADRRAQGLTLRSEVAFGTVGYRINRRTNLALTGYFSGLDRNAEFADWAQLTNGLDEQGRLGGTRISLRQGFGNLALTVSATQTLDLRLSATGFAGGPTSADRIDVGSELYFVRRQFGYRGLEALAEASWRPTGTLTAVMGAGVIADHQQTPAVYHVMKSSFGELRAGDSQLVSTSIGNVTLWNPGAHSLALWVPRPWLSLTAGARYDYHNIYGGRPSARLGGVVALTSTLRLKVLYGSAFKAPSPQLLWGLPLAVGDISGNSRLRPSYLHTVEGQLAYRPTPFLLLTTGLAYSYVLDQAAFALVGVNQVAQNVAQVESISWESEVKIDWRRRIAMYANVTLNRTRQRISDPGYSAQLTSYPNIAYPLAVAHAGSSAAVPGLPLRLSVEGSFVSARPSSGANALSQGGRYFLDPYFLLGASVRTIGLELFPQRETSLALTGRNLLGAQAANPGFSGIDYPLLGRTVMLQLSQEL